jgi:hypothetical protein
MVTAQKWSTAISFRGPNAAMPASNVGVTKFLPGIEEVYEHQEPTCGFEIRRR